MCEIIITASSKDAKMILPYLSYFYINLNPSKISIISNKNIKPILDKFYPSVNFIDENNIIEGLSFNSITELIQKRHANASRAGWYFQQFIKMAYSQICTEEYYIIWDADTIPLHQISFFNNTTRKPLFNMKQEFHKPYFETMHKLLGLNKIENMSFISENMIIKTNYMKELIADICNCSCVSGNYFFEKIINAIDYNDLIKCGFSEFETYGTYVSSKYPNAYDQTAFNSYRYGNSILGKAPTTAQLTWISEHYEAVALEQWDFEMPLIPFLLRFAFFRKCISLEKATSIGNKWRKLLSIAIEIRTQLRA